MEAPPPGRPSTRVQLAFREWLGLTALASAAPLLGLIAAIVSPAPDFNDFNSYWLAGGLVDRGLSPHALDALAALGEQAGREFVLGTGYSYPLPFAVAMVPLSRMPFDAALAVFLGASIVAFALAVAAWLRWLARWPSPIALSPRRVRLAALLAGAFPPVIGSVQAAQANLLVVAALGLAVRWLLDPTRSSRAAGAGLVGVASVVKLVPIAVVVPLVLGRRGLEAGGVVAAGLAFLGLGALLAPASAGNERALLGLLAPDPYFTNVSINGFVSRLVLPTDRSAAVIEGAFDPALVAALATSLFAAATLAVLWQARAGLRQPPGLALGIGFAILAAVIGGPKNSFWNTSLSLVTVGLLLASETSWALAAGGGGARRPRLDRLDRWLLVAWLAGVAGQTLVWIVPPPPTGMPIAPLVTLAGSAALYGMLALWCFLARRLTAPDPRSRSEDAALS